MHTACLQAAVAYCQGGDRNLLNENIQIECKPRAGKDMTIEDVLGKGSRPCHRHGAHETGSQPGKRAC
jgi:hypothetical protein